MALGDKDTPYDVLIIGAGMSGLAAAQTILGYRGNTSIVVLERSAVVGGRVQTDGGFPGNDYGAAYFGPLQTYTMALVHRYELPWVRNSMPAEKLSFYQGGDRRVLRFFGENFPLTDEIVKAVAQIEGLVLGVKAHLERPRDAPYAKELDGVSVEQWGRASLPPGYPQDLLRVAVRSAFSVEPAEMSMLYLLYYSATCNSFLDFENVNSDGDCFRLVGGMSGLVGKLAEEVRALRAEIRTSTEVQKVHNREGLVEAEVLLPSGAAGSVWARHTIVAMSPARQAELEGEGLMSEPRRATCKAMVSGFTIKGFAQYAVPWWRESYSGYGLSAAGPVNWVMDNTSVTPDGVVHPALMTFVCGDAAKGWLSPAGPDTPERFEARREAVITHLVELFRDERARTTLVEYKDGRSVGFSPHGPAHALPPGVLTVDSAVEGPRVFPEALRVPVGLVHWAGSELATNWVGGYVNGAIQSGMRAGGEVFERLRAGGGGPPGPLVATVASSPPSDGILAAAIRGFR